MGLARKDEILQIFDEIHDDTCMHYSNH